MFRRQHHCRLCGILCCDDCSKKRIQISGTPVRKVFRCEFLAFNKFKLLIFLVYSIQARSCDSCYNAAAHRIAVKTSSSTTISTSKPSGSAAQLNAEANRKELLSGATLSNNSNQSANKNGNLAGTESGIGAAMNNLNEARVQLDKRGETLSKLADNSQELSDAAGEFAKMAKMLNEQQRNRWF